MSLMSDGKPMAGLSDKAMVKSGKCQKKKWFYT